MTHRLHSYLGYSYPVQLSDLIKKVWPADNLDLLPADSQLRLILDVAYHATLLREEQRPVTFRLMLGDQYVPDDVRLASSGLSPLVLHRSRPFNEQEVRRISMAADFFRSLIGVYPDQNEHLRIWGILLSGTRWVNSFDGGRFASSPFPPRLVIHGLGPGRLTIFIGQTRVAALSGGQLEANAFDLFQAKWLHEAFADARQEAYKWTLDQRFSMPFVPMNVDFLRTLSQNVLRRTLSVVRNSKHGGTLVFVDGDEEAEVTQPGGPMRFKYRLALDDSRARYITLVRCAMSRLTQLAHENQFEDVTWEQYQSFADHELTELDERLFEFAHFLGDLMAVDGALVMTKQMEIVGFGSELLAEAPKLGSVRRAMDVEASIWVNESLDDVGTRHRAVYRLCEQYPNCVAVVISQDGSVRFVKRHNGAVTYWNQLSW